MFNENRSFCVYCKNVEINDATFRYIELIRGGLRDAGFRDLGITQNRNILQQASLVVTISCLPAIKAILLHPKGKIVHWFQGIEATERLFLHKGWRGWMRWVMWTMMEHALLRHAKIKLFVSQQMRDFLGDEEKSGQASLVIPCYNVDLCEITSSDQDRYRRINLVYAGSMYPWQCVRESLNAYRWIRGCKPEATMTILTREVDLAKSMCNEMGLNDVTVEAVSPEKLLKRLQDFSFGFILRANMAINEVSTPTKFSSYLGAGVIPVMTKATPALVAMASDVPYKVIVKAPSNSKAIAEGVFEICGLEPTPNDVTLSFRNVFERYFNDDSYRRLIADVAKRLH